MATRTRKVTGTGRSSLTDHTFPSFYACYLLKSISTPRANATYIGSTPNPPKRIRQHNGEISQGASKTRNNRPWEMQMIVHGFPSRVAALQFEWAWQHPYRSRHIRDEEGKNLFGRGKTRYLKTNILVARTMVSTHPYTIWPLHVKLFTPDAVKHWSEACRIAEPQHLHLPPGFTCVTELEGVAGKSKYKGLGRTVPIDVSDGQFTAAHLSKYKALVTSKDISTCTICGESLNISSDHLLTALCPVSTCTATSHLSCLSSGFLAQEESIRQVQKHPTPQGMIPRGGTCKSCHEYVLWGDIIKGCYRRRAGGAVPTTVEEEDENEGELFDMDDQVDDNPAQMIINNKKEKTGKTRNRKYGVAVGRNAKAGSSSQAKAGSKDGGSESGEFFDIDAIGSVDELSEEDDPPMNLKKRRGRPPGNSRKGKEKDLRGRGHHSAINHVVQDPSLSGMTMNPLLKPKPVMKRKRAQPTQTPNIDTGSGLRDDDEREFFDLSGISSTEDGDESGSNPKMKQSSRLKSKTIPGRHPAMIRPVEHLGGMEVNPRLKPKSDLKRKQAQLTKTHCSGIGEAHKDDDDEREFFDLSAISSGSEESDSNQKTKQVSKSKSRTIPGPQIQQKWKTTGSKLKASVARKDTDMTGTLEPSEPDLRQGAKPKSRARVLVVPKQGEVDFFVGNESDGSGDSFSVPITQIPLTLYSDERDEVMGEVATGNMDDDTIVRALSTLSVSSPDMPLSPIVSARLIEGEDVILVSD